MEQIAEQYKAEISDIGQRMNQSIQMLMELTELDAISIGEPLFYNKEFILDYIKDCPLERKLFILNQLI